MPTYLGWDLSQNASITDCKLHSKIWILNLYYSLPGFIWYMYLFQRLVSCLYPSFLVWWPMQSWPYCLLQKLISSLSYLWYSTTRDKIHKTSKSFITGQPKWWVCSWNFPNVWCACTWYGVVRSLREDVGAHPPPLDVLTQFFTAPVFLLYWLPL